MNHRSTETQRRKKKEEGRNQKATRQATEVDAIPLTFGSFFLLPSTFFSGSLGFCGPFGYPR
jgi:hypothetical protein